MLLTYLLLLQQEVPSPKRGFIHRPFDRSDGRDASYLFGDRTLHRTNFAFPAEVVSEHSWLVLQENLLILPPPQQCIVNEGAS